jgi:hypothetical protein
MVGFYIALMAPRFLRSQDLDDLEDSLADE